MRLIDAMSVLHSVAVWCASYALVAVLGVVQAFNFPFPAVFEDYQIQKGNGTKAIMGYAELVIGPAGSGKSTYCSSLFQHCEAVGRTIHVVNLDPAAENFDYPVAVDIRQLICLEDVMEELRLGPNGGLIYCMEHLEDNLDGWLSEELDNYSDDDYLVFDCPGQIELFSHVPVLTNFVEHLSRKNFNVCVVYLLDSRFDIGKLGLDMKLSAYRDYYKTLSGGSENSVFCHCGNEKLFDLNKFSCKL